MKKYAFFTPPPHVTLFQENIIEQEKLPATAALRRFVRPPLLLLIHPCILLKLHVPKPIAKSAKREKTPMSVSREKCCTPVKKQISHA